jgi:5-methylcytosine-specific restriction endonuclease McrA
MAKPLVAGEQIVTAKRERPNFRRMLEVEARRSATLALRFRILARDRFRCMLCGNSPATDPQCKLHVDHIVPFSKGGRTTPANLRALCAGCNIGRGNRVRD